MGGVYNVFIFIWRRPKRTEQSPVYRIRRCIRAFHVCTMRMDDSVCVCVYASIHNVFYISINTNANKVIIIIIK